MATVPSAPFTAGVARGADSLRRAKDMRARFAGVCGVCREQFAVGAVIVLTVRGWAHAVCPRDWPSTERGSR